MSSRLLVATGTIGRRSGRPTSRRCRSGRELDSVPSAEREPDAARERRGAMRQTTKRLVRSVATVAILGSLVACSAAASPGSPQPSGGVAASPSPMVATADAAAAQVLTQLGRWPGLGPFDPNAIGQCCGYRVTASPAGWAVTIEVGWGDCPAGCINRHEWRY